MNILSNNNHLLRSNGTAVYIDYSAGPNIDITDHVISGKDWTDEINSAVTSTSASIVDSAYNQSTAWVDSQNYLTEHQDVSNLPYVKSDALSSNGTYLVGISGSGFMADSANSATYADTAQYARRADSAQIAYSALNVPAGGSNNYVVKTGDIEFDMVSSTLDNSGMVLPYATTMGGANFYQFDTSGVGSRKTFIFTYETINERKSLTVWQSGSTTGAETASDSKVPACSAYSITTDNPQPGIYVPTAVCNLRIIAPASYDYGAQPTYTAYVDGNSYPIQSGSYCDFVRVQTGYLNQTAWATASGSYSF